MKNTEIVLLVGQLKGTMDSVVGQVNDVLTKLGELPCAVHSSNIEALKAWKQTCNGANANHKLESYKGRVSLRNTIIAIALTAVFSVLVTLLSSFFLIGKP